MRNRLFGVFISSTIVIFSFIPVCLIRYSPRYYWGDPHFSVQQYKELALKQQSELLGNQAFSEDNIILPSKELSDHTVVIIGLSLLLTCIWGFSWSVYAYITHKLKWLIWTSFCFYLLVQSLLLYMLIAGAMGIS